MVAVTEESFRKGSIDHAVDVNTQPALLPTSTTTSRTVVVVSGLANIIARVNEDTVLFSQKATASQLYHAVFHLSTGFTSPDGFNLVIDYNHKKYPLKFENTPIPNLDLEPSKNVHCANIGVNTMSEITNGDTEHENIPRISFQDSTTESSSEPTKACFMQVSPTNDQPPNPRTFLLSPWTTYGDLYRNILFVRASRPSETTIRLYSCNSHENATFHETFQTIDSANSLRETLQSFDFTKPHQNLILSIKYDLSECQVLPRTITNNLFRHSESNELENRRESQNITKSYGDSSARSITIKVALGESLEKDIHERKEDVKAPQAEPNTKPEMVYVGLVNQAMTCYLNSLLQALYMTPEFRNALYNWEYDGAETDKASTNIPYQLQKLFLNLQTSTKAAVETTSLTKSFGWDSTAAWQQHDIQELCRVMFDALEQKFKNTQQSDLINRLYEGKMIDYVKCLECSTEKSREDTFLDIPLPVKPFGSNVAYNSVEEALRAFVQPETLDGTNQYFCETCNEKCDAHKGLKFSKFPYLLTLHLKRFDFDNNTFHRIKLNDRVSFPDILNLNSFIASDNPESPIAEEDAGVGVKCDDGSTTDSGGLDDCPTSNGLREPADSTTDHLSNHEQDDDEGIDMTNGPSTSSTEHSQEEHRPISGPYIYELFSIMIHSGSASGGHYYAYIKDFRTNEWLCFNDQNVTPITDYDIQKTYGGGPTRGYYSGAYSSSTNAYMLMYRLIDSERNCLPMEMDNFPTHIQQLLKKMQEEREQEERFRIDDRYSNIYKTKVYVHHPGDKTILSKKVISFHDQTLSEVVEKAWMGFYLQSHVDLDQCRLVTYHAASDTIESIIDHNDPEILNDLRQCNEDMLLEIRKKGEQWEQYAPGGLGTNVFHVDLVKKEILDGSIYVRATETQTVKEYKQQVGKILNLDPDNLMVIFTDPWHKTLIANDNGHLASEGFTSGVRVFVSASNNLRIDSSGPNNTIVAEIQQKLNSILCLDAELPDTSKEALDEFNIQLLSEEESAGKRQRECGGESKGEVSGKEVEKATGCKKGEEGQADWSWVPPPVVQGGDAEDSHEAQEQSNSEDSSLSDSDRTLVGNASEDDEVGLVPMEEGSHSSRTPKDDNWDMVDDTETYFFRATPYQKSDKRHLRVMVDKRMSLSSFKNHLEPFVGVSVENFKVVVHQSDFGDRDCRIRSTLRHWKDGQNISIKLGSNDLELGVLKPNEFRVKVFGMELYDGVVMLELFESTISKDATVATVKKQLLRELQKNNGEKIAFERCRLRIKQHLIPSKVLLDDQIIRDIAFTSQELFIQELEEDEPVRFASQTVLMVVRMSTADGPMGAVKEIVLEEKSFDELCRKIVEISGIPMERLQLAKGKWPGNSFGSSYSWFSNALQPPLDSFFDGAIIIYRDDSEKASWKSEEAWRMEMEDESRKVVRNTLTQGPRRVARNRLHGEYSRREKALKIYYDDK